MLELIALCVGVVTTLLITLAVLIKNTRSVTNRLFFVLVLGLIGWSVSTYFSLQVDSDQQTLQWIRFVMFFVVLQNTGFYLVSKYFPASNSAFFKDRNTAVYLVFSVLVGAIALSPLLFGTFKDGSPVPGIGMALFLPHALFSIFGGLVRLFLRSHRARGNEKRQFQYFIAGTVALFTLVPFSNFIMPVVFGNSFLVQFSPLYSIIFSGLFAYAIIRHKLFDIRLVVARSLGYILSIAFLTTVFGAMAILATLFLQQDSSVIPLENQIFFALLAVVVGLVFQPIKHTFDKLTNSIFYRDAYSAQELLNDHNQVVVSETDIEPLLRLSSNLISNHIKTEFVVIGLRETAYSPIRMYGTKDLRVSDKDIMLIRSMTPYMKQQIIIADDLSEQFSEVKALMKKYDVAAIARLATTEEYEIEGLGYLLLGHKKSGNTFNLQDVRVLRILANELVIAVQNALRFEEIEKFADTLQDKVETATAQLRKTNAKLKAMDETKDEFISMASHQLRTPLTSVKGYVSMVLEGDAGELNEMQSKLLNQAFISSQRMVYLISDLLNVSRLRTGKFVIESKPTNLADAVEGEINQLKEVAKGRNVTLTYNKPAEFTELPLDETKIRQVVMNFTDNAIYYTPSGGEIAVNVAETDDTIEFTVKDSGMGVPKSEQPHLFTKFYRAGNAKKARPDGTGLGLFMAKKVVIAQGGSIIFDSKEGKGSTFGFRFSKKVLQEKASQPKTVALPDPEQD